MERYLVKFNYDGNGPFYHLYSCSDEKLALEILVRAFEANKEGSSKLIKILSVKEVDPDAYDKAVKTIIDSTK